MVEYYSRIARVAVPHTKRRPVTLKRYPDGVAGNFFYEKRCPPHRPEWINTVTIRRKRDQKDMAYCVLDNKASLLWAVNLGNLELHTSLARVEDISRPTSMVFDLDPGPPATVIDCADVALRLKAVFDDVGLASLCKTSGSKGMQLYVPLNTNVGYDQTRPLARTVAQLLEEETPDRVTSTMRKDVRARKVLIDWSQNNQHKRPSASIR